MDERPIGVFDSGLGGLTAFRDLQRIMPDESIIYFGDTARVPYGTRSPHTIREYARQDMDFLLSKNVKAIIAACGTVSSVASDIADSLPVPFFGVVEPAAAAAVNASKSGRIGIIGTTATVRSGAYERAIRRINSSVVTFTTDCPLFVPVVEAGWVGHDEIAVLCAKRYLEDIRSSGVDTLILGCTHFPLISGAISDVMGSDVTLISAGAAAAQVAADKIISSGLAASGENKSAPHFYVTDRPDGFSRTAGIFLQGSIDGEVEQITIG